MNLLLLLALAVPLGCLALERTSLNAGECQLATSAPVDQPGENFLRNAWGHVGSCLDVATFAPSRTGTQASPVMSTALRRSNVAVLNLRSNSRARRHESSSSVCVGGRAISAYSPGGSAAGGGSDFKSTWHGGRVSRTCPLKRFNAFEPVRRSARLTVERH
jgi:hypothetical protein